MKLLNPIGAIDSLLLAGFTVSLYNDKKVMQLAGPEVLQLAGSEQLILVQTTQDYTADEVWDTKELPWKDCGLDVKDMLYSFITEHTEIEVS